MIRDPIVEEVYEARRKILEECGWDLGRLLDRLKAEEAKDADRLVGPEEFRRRKLSAKRDAEIPPDAGEGA